MAAVRLAFTRLGVCTTLAPEQRTTAARAFRAARELSSHYDTMKSEAQRRLGTLFNAGDYSQMLDGRLNLEVTNPAIEPPNSLLSLHPDVYQAEGPRYARDSNPPALPVFRLRALSPFSCQVLGKKRQQELRIVDRRTGPALRSTGDVGAVTQ